MHIILTHEQADFDALASLLGASLVNPDALAVLPHRLNRNVADFVKLYKSELRMISIQELPAEPITNITLVDTQSLITLRGMTKKTAVDVIDHHEIKKNTPSHWSIFTHDLGACSTIFIESIKENNIPLSIIQSTLLLLGLYEDTGSLSFSRTTPRDVRAAAYLLEQKASLKIANKFLYPPLSSEQKIVLDELIRNQKNYSINAANIIISYAEAEEMVDEVSSIAHKMRDMFDPDGLILFINTPEGIRLVARSTSDQVNVSEIAKHFNGGGHQRAAAALIRKDEIPTDITSSDYLQKTIQEFEQILPGFIEPAMTVGQIMSRNPLLLTPAQSAKEAAKLMQRYGYEGYPVVEQSRIIGLLTRRAVDRALSHQLNLSVGSLMDAGEVFVYPHETIEKLQSIMRESDWGQIPVIAPITKEIIGIVTRTDLIKTMSNGQIEKPFRPNLSSKLEKALPTEKLNLLKRITSKANLLSMPVYIVGGFVRDLLLNRPSLDFDIVVEGNAIDLVKEIKSEYGGKVTSHKQFGTAKWQIDTIKSIFQEKNKSDQEENQLPSSIDFISARTEFYDYPTALPKVETSSIKFDLHRRDFSINTLALRLDGDYYGELYDYWGGLNDLQKGSIRVLHSLSFVDDPTRMLRAVRFEQRFNFNIEERTLDLMDEAHNLLKQISADRIRHELDLIMKEDKTINMLNRLSNLGLLTAIHTSMKWDPSWAKMFEKGTGINIDTWWKLEEILDKEKLPLFLKYAFWFSFLGKSDVEKICKRLKTPAYICKYLSDYFKIQKSICNLEKQKPSYIVKTLEQFSVPSLFLYFKTTENKKERDIIKNYIKTWQYIQSTFDGNHLKALGIKPGPIYKTIIGNIRDAKLDGQIQNQAEEKQYLDQIIENLPPSDFRKNS